METRIMVLRHAVTSAPERILGAETDLGLGPQGVKQAEALAFYLGEQQPLPKFLFCSNLLRAKETAAPIAAACKLTPQIVPELHERRMGNLSGKPRVSVLKEYLEVQERWMSGDLDFTNPGGETYREMRNRLVPAFERIMEICRGSYGVVVTHGLAIRVLFTSILEGLSPRELDKIGIDCTAMNDLIWDGKRFRFRVMNQRAPGVH